MRFDTIIVSVIDSVEPVNPHSNLTTAKEPNQLIHARVSQCNLRRWDQIKTTQISPHDGSALKWAQAKPEKPTIYQTTKARASE